MTDPTLQQDAAAAALVARVKRLMIVTLGATFLALAVVLMIIGYRVFNSGGSLQPGTTESVLRLPAGARVLSANTAEGRIVVTVQSSNGIEILTFDANTLKQISRLRVATEP